MDKDKFLSEKLVNFKKYCLSFLDPVKDKETIDWLNKIKISKENLDLFKSWILTEIKPIIELKNLVLTKSLLKSGNSSSELKRFKQENIDKVYQYLCMFCDVI